MERKKSQLRTSITMAIPFFAAFGLMAMVGCGSSDNGSNTDSSTNVTGGNNPEVNSPDVQVRSEVSSSIEVQAAEANVQVDLGSDGPSAIDSPPSVDLPADLPADKPITTDVTGTDTISTGGNGGNVVEAGQGTGGAGGSTSSAGTGGSTLVSGTGGSLGTGGTGGAGTSGSASISGWPTTSLDAPYSFPSSACAGAAQPAPAAYTFTLTNTGTAAVTFVGASFSGASGYSVDLTAGTSKIQPGESKVVTITPPAIPFTLSPPATISSVLTLMTDEPTGNLHTIFLAEQVHGAKLAWGSGAATTFMGGIAPATNNTLTQDFTVLNTGDQPATVDIVSSYASFAVSSPATAVAIPAGGSVTRTLTFTAPPQEGSYNSAISLVPSATNNLCAPVPVPWTATALSLIGYPEFTPSGGEFDFSGFCGTTPPNRTITIKNVGTDTLKWLPVIVGNNPCFTIVQPSVPEGTTRLDLSVDATATIEIGAAKIADNATTTCSGELDVNFDTATGSYKNAYTLNVLPLGAVITITPSAHDFGQRPITSLATPVDPIPLTLHNAGFADTVGNLDTTITVTLTIDEPTSPGSPLPFIFEAHDSELAGPITHVVLDANHGNPNPDPTKDKTVMVKYQRPEVGPYSSTADDYHITWSVAADKSCSGASGTNAVELKGSVTEAVVSYGFENSFGGDFGSVFCGDVASPAYLDVTNQGNGPLNITSALPSTSYFKITPSPTPGNPVVVNGKDPNGATHKATFAIEPQTIDPAIIGHGDLQLGSHRFDTTLTLMTDAPASLGNPSASTTITMAVTMSAKGIYIDSVDPTTWSYQSVDWPTNTSGSIFTTKVVNSGNVGAVASLTSTIGKFALSGTGLIAPGGGETPLYSNFGPFTNCDTTSTTYNASGSLSFAADDGTGHAVAGGLGVCHGSSVPLSLSGQVLQNGSMCNSGQRCSGSTGAGQCVCDNTSCGSLGCCTQVGPGGSCVLYGNQTANKDPQHMGCGNSGDACQACDDYLGGAICDAGSCHCTGGKVYCPVSGSPKCVTLASSPDNCGSCGVVCSSYNVDNRTCTNSACDGTCQSGWTNCDKTATSMQQYGCNVHTDADPDNCGGCGIKCSNENIPTRTCGSHVCNGTCAPGYADCDGNKQTNGCEINTNINLNNCGGCGNKCASGQSCEAGSCVCDTTSGCAGCCDSNLCQPGTDNATCGTGGAACTSCTSMTPGTWFCQPQTQTCQQGT